jgi:hypothetical protein
MIYYYKECKYNLEYNYLEEIMKLMFCYNNTGCNSPLLSYNNVAIKKAKLMGIEKCQERLYL